MTIPAGGYRASKTIDVNGDFTENVAPGSFLDSVVFAGRSGVQRWKVQGALLRKVRITGKRGVSLHAIDTALEECEFSKDDNWYFNWWSTTWKFENCIFTRKFIRADLPPLDFAAHASRCTFYGVTLPSIGMKEDPAKYLQKEHMGFVQCRFVQCEVPETFLAATVDCVFENCRFPAKKHVWPKETGAIKVNAFYTGLGSAPKSFINGPVAVLFSEAPRDAAAGSTLAHTQSAGRVTLAALREPAQFTALGTAAKKASEIPLSNDGAPAFPSPTALPAPGAMPPALPPPDPLIAGAAGELDGLAEVLRSLPATIDLQTGGQINVTGVVAANEWLAANAQNRAAVFKAVLNEAKAYKDKGYAFQITGRGPSITVRGAALQSQVVARFRADTAAALARVSKGREIQVRGVVSKAVIEGSGRSLILTVTLDEAKLQ